MTLCAREVMQNSRVLKVTQTITMEVKMKKYFFLVPLLFFVGVGVFSAIAGDGDDGYIIGAPPEPRIQNLSSTGFEIVFPPFPKGWGVNILVADSATREIVVSERNFRDSVFVVSGLYPETTYEISLAWSKGSTSERIVFVRTTGDSSDSLPIFPNPYRIRKKIDSLVTNVTKEIQYYPFPHIKWEWSPPQEKEGVIGYQVFGIQYLGILYPQGVHAQITKKLSSVKEESYTQTQDVFGDLPETGRIFFGIRAVYAVDSKIILGPMRVEEAVLNNEKIVVQNYPNPFNPTTNIRYTLPQQKRVSLKIYNIMGQVVKTLVNDQVQTKGTYEITWDGTNDAGLRVSSGTYIYSLEFGNFKKSKRMMLVK